MNVALLLLPDARAPGRSTFFPAFSFIVARDLHSLRRTDTMATKVRIMKLLQEIRGMAQITSRRPPSKQPGLFMVQLRSHVTKATGTRRRIIIPIDLKDPIDIPDPVRIIHVKVSQPEPLPAPTP